MEDLLKQIVKNMEHKTSFQIILCDNKSRFKTRFNPTLQLDRDKKIRNSPSIPRNLWLISQYR